MTGLLTAEQIVRILRTGRYRLGNEGLLQADIEQRFRDLQVGYEREKVLGPTDRVDFLVCRHVAVELKIKCPRRRILRQLERYAMHECVAALILVTATAVGMPREIVGKPLYLVSLGLTGL